MRDNWGGGGGERERESTNLVSRKFSISKKLTILPFRFPPANAQQRSWANNREACR